MPPAQLKPQRLPTSSNCSSCRHTTACACGSPAARAGFTGSSCSSMMSGQDCVPPWRMGAPGSNQHSSSMATTAGGWDPPSSSPQPQGELQGVGPQRRHQHKQQGPLAGLGPNRAPWQSAPAALPGPYMRPCPQPQPQSHMQQQVPWGGAAQGQQLPAGTQGPWGAAPPAGLPSASAVLMSPAQGSRQGSGGMAMPPGTPAAAPAQQAMYTPSKPAAAGPAGQAAGEPKKPVWSGFGSAPPPGYEAPEPEASSPAVAAAGSQPAGGTSTWSGFGSAPPPGYDVNPPKPGAAMASTGGNQPAGGTNTWTGFGSAPPPGYAPLKPEAPQAAAMHSAPAQGGSSTPAGTAGARSVGGMSMQQAQPGWGMGMGWGPMKAAAGGQHCHAGGHWAQQQYVNSCAQRGRGGRL